MTSPSIVRAATPDDEPQIWRLFDFHHRENGIFTLSKPKVQNYLDRALYPERLSSDDTGPRGIIGVIGPQGALEAVIMLILGPVWYSDDIAMQDAVSFVDPEHRRSDHARALIGYAKHITDRIRESHSEFRMLVGIVSTKRTAAKIRLYSRQLSVVGAFFCHPPPAGFQPMRRAFQAD